MLTHLEGVLTFTLEPPDPSYARNGSNATLTWDYSVDDKQAELGGIIYSVKDSSGAFKGILVLQNDGNVVEHAELPSTYKGRVTVEGAASLIIENVTREDNAVFQCKLVANQAADVISAVQLIVTGTYCNLNTKSLLPRKTGV